MIRRSVPNETGFILKRRALAAAALLTMATGFLGLPTPVQAQAPMGVSVGAGLRTSFTHTGSTSVSGSFDRYVLDSARIYVNGTAAPMIKFTFNTEYKGDGSDSTIRVIDAVGRYEKSPGFNLWMGRFLPPSDRANLHGPYYAHEWGSYTDSIQDGYPTSVVGRANGLAYWGDFGKFKASFGTFDGPTTTGNPKILMAGRAQYDFWDAESGYYLNGTYYGGKKVLALGGAFQSQASNTSANLDFLLEKKLPGMGVVSVQSEYAYYDKLGGWNGNYGLSRGVFVEGSYLFPQMIGMGKVEILGKFAENKFSSGVSTFNPPYKQKTSEADLSYIIKDFNARVTAFYLNKKFSAVAPSGWQVGLGLQIQM